MNYSLSKHQLALLLIASLSSSAQGFTVPFDRSFPASALSTAVTAASSPRTGNSCLFSTDFDFPSAMPEKPELTMEEKLIESADNFIEAMDNQLSDKSIAPPELEALREARKANADPKEMTLKIYELMIERAMRYDEDPETSTLTPTGFDIPNNLDVPEVKKEFAHLYSYGMMLMNRGMLDGETLKGIVIERLIKRTELTPEEFDKWLGY
uniref:RxLR effector protein n=1 Tax=Pseudo-nitzschia delicatissima TaxID=44447 RepID=A0A7S0TDI5_9STRA|mmetsp:Transcript_451/g.985  ORF Transcript_451/g.985 Transcript_451/m.985 type:complete len:210 (+) Transcript_451:113-742(+)